MYAVAGTWRMDPAMREQQAQGLDRIVAGVRGIPGFVRGFWSRDLDDPDVSLTYIVFETVEQARSFREAVAANAPGQGDVGIAGTELRIAQVEADA